VREKCERLLFREFRFAIRELSIYMLQQIKVSKNKINIQI